MSMPEYLMMKTKQCPNCKDVITTTNTNIPIYCGKCNVEVEEVTSYNLIRPHAV